MLHRHRIGCRHPVEVGGQRGGQGPGAEAERAQVGVAWHVVGVDLLGSTVRHPHGRAVGPDAPGVGVPGLQVVEVPDRVPLPSVQRVGEELFLGLVRHPHGRAVGPEVSGPNVPVPLRGVDVLVGVPLPADLLVGVDPVKHGVRDPHGRAVGPDAPGPPGRPIRQVDEVAVLVPLLGGPRVGEDPLVVVVRHPHGRAVGPDAPDAAVASLVQGVEVLVGIPLPAGQRVGEELVRPIVPHPHGHAVGPDASGTGVPGCLQGVEVVLGLPAEGGVRPSVDADGVVPRGDAVTGGHGHGHDVAAHAQIHLVSVGPAVGVGTAVGHRGVGVGGDARNRHPRHRVGHAELVGRGLGVEPRHALAAHAQSAQVGIGRFGPGENLPHAVPRLGLRDAGSRRRVGPDVVRLPAGSVLVHRLDPVDVAQLRRHAVVAVAGGVRAGVRVDRHELAGGVDGQVAPQHLVVGDGGIAGVVPTQFDGVVADAGHRQARGSGGDGAVLRRRGRAAEAGGPGSGHRGQRPAERSRGGPAGALRGGQRSS